MKNTAAGPLLSESPRQAYVMRAGLAVLLFGIIFALFSPTLEYGLVDFDDIVFISNNAVLHEGLTLSSIRQAFSLRNTSGILYMPLTWISYMMDAEWLGATPVQPGGYHFTNVLLHAFNAVCAYWLFLAFSQKPWRAFFCAALWAIHPLRAESIAWVSDRKDLLSAFFGLLCLGAYLRFATDQIDPARARHSPRWFYAAAVVFFALGLLAKPALAPLPGALLLLDLWPLKRIDFASASLRRFGLKFMVEKIPFIGLAALASYGASAAHQATHALTDVPGTIRFLAVPLHYVFYLFNFIWPTQLTPLYPDISVSIVPAVFAAAALAAATAWIWISRRERPEWLVGWLWFLGFLLPVIGIVRFGIQSIADRYTYLPAIGLSIALLSVARSGKESARVFVRLRFVLASLVLGLLGMATWHQLPVWQNAETLTAHVLDVFPNHATALETRAGNVMRNTGDFQEANRLVSLALRSHPHHWKALLAKAQCLWALEGPAAAHAFLNSIRPPTPLYTLSNWRRDQARYALMVGEHERALQASEQAAALLPPQDAARTPLVLLAMVAAFEKGDEPRALSHARQFPPYARKTSLDLADLLPHYIFQWVAGYRRDTYEYFQRLLRTYPDRPDFLNNVVWGLATAEWSPADPQEVLDLAQRLAGMFPESNPGILDTLGVAQANAGHFDEAARTMREALARLPRSVDSGTQTFRDRLTARLRLYEQGLPYREDAFGRMFGTYYAAANGGSR